MSDPLSQAFHRLDTLNVGAIQSTGDWDLGRMFSHLAQGVEFSMTGYPIQKARVFQACIGSLAFKVFSLRGRMSHGLDDPIPGEVVADVTADEGLQRLYASLEHFRDFDGAMQPHFAYGPLDKFQFAKAHLFHIDNHLQEVRPV